MPTLRDALAKYDALAADGRIPNRKTGGFTTPSRTRRYIFRGNVIAAYELDAGLSGDALLDMEIGPTSVGLLDRLAVRPEEDRGKDRRQWSNLLSDIRLWVSILYDRDVEARPKTHVSMFLPSWIPLANALAAEAEAHVGAGHWAKQQARLPQMRYAELLRLQNEAEAHGITDPRELPDDGADIMLWAPKPDGRVTVPKLLSRDAEAGEREAHEAAAAAYETWHAAMKRHRRLKGALAVYRRARRCLGDVALPTALVQKHSRSRNVRTLPELPSLWASGIQRIERTGQELRPVLDRLRETYGTLTPDLRTVALVDIVRVLAPYIGERCELFLRIGDALRRQPEWMEGAIGGVARLLAALVAHGADVWVLQPWELWLPSQAVATPASGARLMHGLTASVIPSLSPLRVAVRSAADRSLANSPQRAVRAHSGEVELYTETVINDVKSAYSVMRTALESEAEQMPEYAAALTEQLAAMKSEFDSICREMATLNQRREVSRAGRRDKRHLPVTWSQIACVGIPALRRDVLEAECEFRTFGGVPESLEWRKRRETFYRLLRHYVVTAVVLSDGYRRKNHTHGQLNEHFVPTWEHDQEGAIIGLRGLTVRWSGNDSPAQRTKVTVEADGSRRDRPRALLAGIVDLRLLYVYMSEVRECDLRAQGLLGPDECLDLRTDRHALFVSPKGRQQRTLRVRRSAEWGTPSVGQLTDAGLANYFRAGFLRAVLATIETLGIVAPANFPRRPEECSREPWSGCFTPHIVRTLGATQFNAMDGDMVRAREYTDDSPMTIHRHYSKVPLALRNAYGCGDGRDPRWYTPIVDLIHETRLQSCAWDRFWATFHPVKSAPKDVERWRRVLMARSAPKQIATATSRSVRRGGMRGVYVPAVREPV